MKQILFTYFLLFISVIIFGQDSTEHVREIFTSVEVMPRFPGCEEMEGSEVDKEACAKKKMLAYIKGNLIYPDKAKPMKVKGVVVVQFIVTEFGDIKNARVIRAIGFGCDEEALRLVESMNEMEASWKPGRQRGQEVEVLYTLPVRFNPDY